MQGIGSRLSFPITCLAVLCLAACGGSPAGPDLIIDPIQIDSVEVLVATSVPATVDVHVQGVVGDGCSTVHSVKQVRSGSTVDITILRQRPRDAICTQIAQLYDAHIGLEGTFSRGSYLVRVNGVEGAFSVP